ncbi:MAG TPA: AAA family ATPase [Planctomycetota bacterium]|nr:AAA family ATPase [Planctomycetota bacterium]
MIKSLRVQNFKNLANVSTEFGPVNVIIGPNGCGKSSLLQAIDFLRALFYPSIEDYLREKEWVYSDLPNLRQTKKAITWQLQCELGPDEKGACAGEYHYAVEVRRWRYLGVGSERVVYSPKGGSPSTLLDRTGAKLKSFAGKELVEESVLSRLPQSAFAGLEDSLLRHRAPELLHFRNWLGSFRSYFIWDPKVLRKADRGKHLELGLSGEHLAPVLARLKREQPGKFQAVVARVRRLFPTVTDISIRGAKGWGWQEINLIEGNGHSVRFGSQQMSDGVLRFLAVCTFLYAPAVPGVLMFEEPENGLHPQLITHVVQMLKELALRKPPHRCQVFFTTHSPYVLDEFLDQPEAVYVMERGKPLEGASLRRLSDRKDIDLVKTLYQHSLGEAWFSGLIGGTAQG